MTDFKSSSEQFTIAVGITKLALHAVPMRSSSYSKDRGRKSLPVLLSPVNEDSVQTVTSSGDHCSDCKNAPCKFEQELTC